MRMMGIPEKTLGESKMPTDPAAVCLLRPHPLPMCFLWGFSPPQTPAQCFSPSLPILPTGRPGPCPHQHSKDKGLVPAPLQSPREVAPGKDLEWH